MYQYIAYCGYVTLIVKNYVNRGPNTHTHMRAREAEISAGGQRRATKQRNKEKRKEGGDGRWWRREIDSTVLVLVFSAEEKEGGWGEGGGFRETVWITGDLVRSSSGWKAITEVTMQIHRGPRANDRTIEPRAFPSLSLPPAQPTDDLVSFRGCVCVSQPERERETCRRTPRELAVS